MMRVRSVVRDLVLLCLAVAIGWWGRGADTAVLAQHSSSTSSSSSRGGTATADPLTLAFQMTGNGPDAALTLYNPGNRTLYVYERAGAGNSVVNCTYSFAIASPGAAIRRDNCAVGDLIPKY
jgi:hypothetical protein